MNEATQSERVEYLDILRALSMLSVVFLHTEAGNLWANYGSAVWHVSNVLVAVMNTSVPIFFMISGAMLLDSPKTLELGYTLKRRVPRVLVPFVLWSLIYVAYYLAVSWKMNGSPDISAAIDRLKYFPSRPTSGHLWFMYALIPLYILSPLIKKMTDSLDRRLIIYLAAIWVFFSSLLPTLAALLPEAYRPFVVLNRSYDLFFLAGYAGYFIIGHYMVKATWRVPRKLLVAVIVVDTAVISLGTWWKAESTGAYSEAFTIYEGVFTLILTMAIFLLFKDMRADRTLGRVAGPVLRFIVPLTFGVYLMHRLVVDTLSKVFHWWPMESVWMVFGNYFFVLGICVPFIFVLRVIKPLCWAFTGQRYQSLRGGRRNGADQP